MYIYPDVKGEEHHITFLTVCVLSRRLCRFCLSLVPARRPDASFHVQDQICMCCNNLSPAKFNKALLIDLTSLQ